MGFILSVLTVIAVRAPIQCSLPVSTSRSLLTIDHSGTSHFFVTMSVPSNRSPHSDWWKKSQFFASSRRHPTRPEVIYAAFKYLFPKGGFFDPNGKEYDAPANLNLIKGLVKHEVDEARQKLPDNAKSLDKSDPVEATKFMVENYLNHLSAEANPFTYHLVVIYYNLINYVEEKLNSTFDNFLLHRMSLWMTFLECTEELVVKMERELEQVKLLKILEEACRRKVALKYDEKTYRFIVGLLDIL